MPISLLKCFQKHLVVYCLAVKWESLWPGSHVEISWGNTKHRPPAGAQPIGTLSLWNDLWLAKVSRHGLDFLKPENRAMRRCRSLVFSQNTWITICWKVIMEFLPNDAKNILPTAGFGFKLLLAIMAVFSVCSLLFKQPLVSIYRSLPLSFLSSQDFQLCRLF